MMNELIFFLSLLAIAASMIIGLQLGIHALFALMSLLGVLANLFVSKQITLFGLTATASDALAVGVTLSLNLIQEFYGRHVARNAIITSFFCLLVYTLFSKLHLWYDPSVTDYMQQHFTALLKTMPRITFASLTTYFIVQNIEVYVYTLSKKIFPAISFAIRNILSISITQGIDTILFSFLGLYGLVSNIGQIILISYIIKLITIFCLIPLVKFFMKSINIRV